MSEMVILVHTRDVSGDTYDRDIYESNSGSSPDVGSDSSASILVWWLVPNNIPNDAQSMSIYHLGTRLGNNRAGLLEDTGVW
eukprot:9473502-Lingulodinium_polyedra.AAC.1